MTPLQNQLHERFANLMATGNNATQAYRVLRPYVKNPHALAHRLMKRPEVRSRIEEIRRGVSEKTVMNIAEKRDLLRQMAEGQIPTKRFDKATGKTHDFLAAVVADAKVAGEVGRKEALQGVLPFKLVFNIPHRSQLDFD